jgi:hypothetical protein
MFSQPVDNQYLDRDNNQGHYRYQWNAGGPPDNPEDGKDDARISNLRPE